MLLLVTTNHAWTKKLAEHPNNRCRSVPRVVVCSSAELATPSWLVAYLQGFRCRCTNQHDPGSETWACHACLGCMSSVQTLQFLGQPQVTWTCWGITTTVVNGSCLSCLHFQRFSVRSIVVTGVLTRQELWTSLGSFSECP
jgi:hypothetical protein